MKLRLRNMGLITVWVIGDRTGVIHYKIVNVRVLGILVYKYKRTI